MKENQATLFQSPPVEPAVKPVARDKPHDVAPVEKLRDVAPARNHDYRVTLEADFVILSKCPEDLRRSVIRVAKQEGFSDVNFEIGIQRQRGNGRQNG